MRLVLALVLLLQLEPVIGAALCLQRAHAATAECDMPERANPAERILAPAGAQVEGGCSVAQLCAPPAPVISQIGELFQFGSLVHRSSLPVNAPGAPGGALPPPFHPPRV